MTRSVRMLIALLGVAACAPLPPPSPSSPQPATAVTRPHHWRRRAPCPACGRTTNQVRHGLTADGALAKGHLCTCGGWRCLDCGEVVDRSGSCCRGSRHGPHAEPAAPG